MLQNKKFTIFLSIVIALLLWVYVIGEVNPTTTKKFENIPVKLLNTENLASKGLVVLDNQNLTVTLTVEGKRADVLSAGLEDLLVTADLFGHGMGENYISLNVELPNGLTLISSEPAKLKLFIDELITADRPVILRHVGESPEGMEPGQIAMDPETVEINGARTLVDQVAYVGADLDISKLTDTLSIQESFAAAYSADGELISRVKLSRETIQISGRMMTVKTVPLRVGTFGQEQPDFQITGLDIPDSIAIRGDRQILESITEVTGKDIDLSAYTASTEIPLEVFLPEGVEVAEASRELTAKLTIKGLSSKTFQFSTRDIDMLDVPEGYAAEILNTNLVVSIADKDPILAEITPDKIQLSLSLQGLGLGAHQVPISVTIEGYSGDISLTPQNASVNLHALQ